MVECLSPFAERAKKNHYSIPNLGVIVSSLLPQYTLYNTMVTSLSIALAKYRHITVAKDGQIWLYSLVNKVSLYCTLIVV